MALSYPVGECFFKRTGLDNGSTSGSDGFRCSDPENFHKRFLIEYVWNVEADHASTAANSPSGWTHPRSGYKISRGEWWDTDYGSWAQLPISYGPKDAITRRNQHRLCVNGNVFRDHEKGGSVQPWFMAMPMPTKEERWVWIDALAHIRGIYIPVSYFVDEKFPDLAYYVQINFTRMGKEIKVWHDGNEFWPLGLSESLGLKVMRANTLGLDIFGLIQLLSLPRQLRKQGPFDTQLIKVVRNSEIKHISNVEYSYSDGYDFSWVNVANANFGVDITWKLPEATSWFENFIKNTLTVAFGFIPGVGPILAIAFPLGWTLLREGPDAFVKELRNLVPGADLELKILEEIKKQAEEQRKYMPDGWSQMSLPTSATARQGADTPAPDEERKASAEVFVQPPDSKPGMGDSFRVADAALDLSNPKINWTPGTADGSTVSSNEPTNSTTSTSTKS